jgi:Xaa-Pro aminopeptidase
MFRLGEASEKQKEICGIIAEAVSRGVEAIRPGTRACDVDKVIRDYINRRGYEEHFGHHSGHGIGLSQIEEPLLIPDNQCELKAGMVLAMEPGIYVPGIGGIKIEEDVLVTDKKGEVLSSFPGERIHEIAGR